MPAAPLPANETQRLASLLKLRILDTPVEERFERITRMVCQLLDVPISVFTLVDENRQWFKSIQGLPASETAREVAFCAHVILGSNIMIVEDASKDARFADNPLVTGDPHIAFYAGYPVSSSDGSRIGTLCAIDRKPRRLTPDQTQLLQDMAAMIESELRRAELSNSHRAVLNELEPARRAALIDPVTRVWNHAGAVEILQREWAEINDTNASLGVIFAELDFTGILAKSHGSRAGDEVLRGAARRMLMVTRPFDAVARFGSKEFLVLLPGCQPEHLALMADRLHKVLQKEPMLTTPDDTLVTMSIGAVTVPGGMGHSIDAAISSAREASHRAREKGRDRTELGSMPPARV